MDNLVINQIRDRLIKQLDLYQLILFGSQVTNTVASDSDIDLIVILNQKGFSKSFAEKIKKRSSVSKLLSEVRRQVPLDILVYTKDEWEYLSKQNSSFMREIRETGVQLI